MTENTPRKVIPLWNCKAIAQAIAPARQVCLAADAAKVVTEMGLTPPAHTTKSFTVMGKTFDPARPGEYVESFAIKWS